VYGAQGRLEWPDARAFWGTDLIPRSDAGLFRALINYVYNYFDDFVPCQNPPKYV